MEIQTRNRSPDVQQLWERARTNDPHIRQVHPDSGNSIRVSPTEDVEKVIWTFGLNGCTSVAVFTEDEEGTRGCVLTHYSPTKLPINKARLHGLISEEMRTAINKQVVLITPGKYTQNPQTKRWETMIENKPTVDELISAVRAELVANVPIKLELYSKSRNNHTDGTDQGVFAVYIPSTGKGDARYQTWFSNGQMSVSSKEK